MATAAKVTIAEVEQLVPLGGLDPDDVHLPGVYVHRVVEVREHEDPFEYRTVRRRPLPSRSAMVARAPLASSPAASALAEAVAVTAKDAEWSCRESTRTASFCASCQTSSLCGCRSNIERSVQ